MLALQGEARLVVIEVPGFPGAGVMAGLALLAESALVHILFFMTAIAGYGRVLERRG